MPSQRALNKASHAFKKLLETEGPEAAQVALDKRGGQVPKEQKQRAQNMINDVRMNRGGPVPGYNYGGTVGRDEEEEKKREMLRQRIASSKVSNQPLSPQQNPQLAAGPVGGQGGGIAQIGTDLAKKALLQSIGGPFGALLGGLFNDGGQVPMKSWYNMGGNVMSPDTFVNGKIKSKHYNHLNMGGMPLNPNGYNEGGQSMETPIKRVMDEQKLEQQAKAFELEQKRKQQVHEQAMRLKEKQAKEAAAMKKAAATTNKTATKPKGPLAT